MPEISIIIPVYNTEKYLIKCLNSIKNQTFQDFEALLIDDGSSDSSPKILDDYARNDTRFKVFHKENGGVTKARKYGIDKATGNYIVWVDSDDWIEEKHLELLYDAITKENADICVCNFIKDSNDGEKKFYEIIKDINNPLKSLIEEDTCRGCLVTKISRRSLYAKEYLFPPEGINCWEDKIITANLYYYSKKTVHIPIFTYHVNDLNNASLTRSSSNAKKNAEDRINVAKYFDSDTRFSNLDLTTQKYAIKYSIFMQNYINQKKIPKNFWTLFPETKSKIKLITFMKNEQINFGLRFIEIFLILSNFNFFAKPFHYILAIMRSKKQSK